MKTNILKLALVAAGLLALPLASQAQTKIYIDPGHGGSDPGAVNSSFGTQEAARVLYTGQQFRDYLNADTANTSGGGSWSVRMSRSTNVTVSLTARSTDANNWGAARFLSIHQNAFNSSANGTETFSFSSTGTGASLRNIVQSEAIQAWNRVNRGNKTANFSVLRNTNMPAILTEMAFIDAPVDHPFCASNVECQKYALHMLYAVQQHYGLAEFNPSTAPTVVTVDNTSSGFSSSTSWFPSTSVSGYLGSNYHARATQSISDTAKYSVTLPSSGTYKVEARWTTGSNRATSTPYVITHNGGNTTVNVNQQANNGTWMNLGNYSFNSGTAQRVQISCWTSSGSFVIADGVRFTKQ